MSATALQAILNSMQNSPVYGVKVKFPHASVLASWLSQPAAENAFTNGQPEMTIVANGS
jgi:hypothetical protein